MDLARAQKLRDTVNVKAWVTVWVIASCIATGIVFGNVFVPWDPSIHEYASFSVGAMFGGFAVGLIACIPLVVIVSLLDRQLQLQYEIHVAPLTSATPAGPAVPTPESSAAPDADEPEAAQH
ncbi:hypothetical protein [Demequina sp. NBRC 110056]|uniref:hypothetical protein n=1 Tax=Demequina sp. NBRC 110056 TaxID=1570345 RepID=UPI0009FF7134|nr:hypothetical protein [Demequina sp. NBRC 110056]